MRFDLCFAIRQCVGLRKNDERQISKILELTLGENIPAVFAQARAVLRCSTPPQGAPPTARGLGTFGSEAWIARHLNSLRMLLLSGVGYYLLLDRYLYLNTANGRSMPSTNSVSYTILESVFCAFPSLEEMLLA